MAPPAANIDIDFWIIVHCHWMKLTVLRLLLKRILLLILIAVLIMLITVLIMLIIVQFF